jgi:hypothetical protein
MEWHELINYGWPTAALCAIAWAAWRCGVAVFARLFDKQDGLLTLYVAETRTTHQRLREYMDAENDRAVEQAAVCLKHADALENTSLGVNGLKRAALQGCQLCRVWAEAFPEQREQLHQHCDQIEQIIQKG